MNIDIAAETAARHDQLIAMRRDFHRHPELAFTEWRTAGIVVEKLRALDFDDVQAGIATTGVVGTLRGGIPGKTVLVRADMDGLPIIEESSADYASQNAAVMHACGHDAHTAMLLTVADILAQPHIRAALPGTIKFLFQPAEETVSGAEPMVAAGVMEGVDHALGMHVWSNLAAGKVGVHTGLTFAAADHWEMTVRGSGGHGAHPDQAIDAIAISAQIISTLQTVVSREVSAIDTAVVTVGTINGGFAFNIIAPEVKLTGTIRTFNDQTRERVKRRVREVAEGVAVAMRGTATIDYKIGCPATVNNPEMSDLVRRSVVTEMGEEGLLDPEPTMGSEDMAYFLNAAPGCYFLIGTAKDDGTSSPHHHPSFDLNERGLSVGVRVMTRAILDTLGA